MVFSLSKIKINKKERENYMTQNVYISKSKRLKITVTKIGGEVVAITLEVCVI